MRAAAKNHAHVGVLVDPADYAPVLDELRDTGHLGDVTRRRLARTAFAHTAAYDAAVVSWFDAADPDRQDGEPADGSSAPLPSTLHLALEKAQVTRYGENPHQRGARYRRMGERSWWDDVEQHSGLELSYLNLYDADAAWRLRPRPRCRTRAVVIIKHANPCGVAVARIAGRGLSAGAYECDARSAFGGIVALNRSVDDDTVDAHGRCRPGRCRHRSRLRRRRRRRAHRPAQEHPHPRRRHHRPPNRWSCARSAAATSSRTRTASPPAATTGAS